MNVRVIVASILAVIALASTLSLVIYNDGFILTIFDNFVSNVVVVLWALLIPSLLIYIRDNAQKKDPKKRTHTCFKVFMLIVSIVLTLLLVALAVVLLYVQGSTFPKTSGTSKLKGGKLEGTVKIQREANGMVHIIADNEGDMYFAQGYAMAQDRLFEMETMRRSGQGRISEMVGASGKLTDRTMRTAGLYRAANKTIGNFPPDLIVLAQHFCDGVNAYVENDSARSFEFMIFNILLKVTAGTSLQIEKYTPVDVALMTKLMGWIMGANLSYETDRYKMLNKFHLTKQRSRELEPLYPASAETVLHNGEFHPSKTFPPADQSLTDCAVPMSLLYEPRFIPTKSELELYQKLVKWFSGGAFASNAWAISGNHTKSGKPLLGNDPHVSFQMPALWWTVHLECKACDIEMIGASLPSVPGIVIGRNKNIAFGVTNSFADVQDYFVLEAAPSDRDNAYIYDGKQVAYEKRLEVIKIPGQPDVVIEVKQSIFGVYANEIVNPPIASPLIMNHTMLLDDDRSAEGFLRIALAKNYQEFRDAASKISGPSLSFVYADKDNNIAYQLVGKVPIRNRRHSGLCPIMAIDDSAQYLGYMSFDNLPNTLNPADGFVASANNRIEPQAFEGYQVGLDVAMEFRGHRISELARQLIATKSGQITIEDMEAIQTDNLSLLFKTYMQPVFVEMGPFNETKYEEWRQRMINWDGVENVDSVEATILEMWFLQLENLTYPEIKSMTQEVYFVINALKNNNDPACLALNMTCIEYAASQLKYAVDFIELHHGKVPKYGDIHLLQFDHVTFSSDIPFTLSSILSFLPKSIMDLLMKIKPIADFLNEQRKIPITQLAGRYFHGPGGTDTVNAAYVLNYPSTRFNYQLPSWHGPTVRLQLDLAENATSKFCQIIGNNGNMFSKTYDNFKDDFVNGKYAPLATENYNVQDTLTLQSE
jgi:penicillin amidase